MDSSWHGSARFPFQLPATEITLSTASGFKNNVIEGDLGCDVVYKVFIVTSYTGFGHLVHLVVAATLVKDQIIQS